MSNITNKKEFIEKIKQWVTIDSQLKIVNEKTKRMRDMKSDLTKNICDYAYNTNLKNNKIEITDGTLSFHEKKDYSTLTYTYVEKCLGDLITDKKQVDYIIQYLKNHREVSITHDIKRTYDKNLQIGN